MYIKTIELTVHISCYLVLDLLCVNIKQWTFPVLSQTKALFLENFIPKYENKLLHLKKCKTNALPFSAMLSYENKLLHLKKMQNQCSAILRNVIIAC